MYVCTAGNNTQEFATLEELEVALFSGFRHDSVNVFLPFGKQVTGRVTRYPGQAHPELVHLHVDGVSVAQLQRRRGANGVLGVSCSPDGVEVLVNSFNLDFRQSNDLLTDRGVVWVLPDSPSAMVTLRPMNFAGDDSITAVLQEAETALQNQFLAHIKQVA